MSSGFLGEASAWTALLPRSQPAWLFPRRALPDERLARKTGLVIIQQPASGVRHTTGVPVAIGVFMLAMVCAGVAAAQTTRTGLGRPATPVEIESWGPIIGPDGAGLPPGRATAADGRPVYQRRCARCHGLTGREGPDTRLAGGQGSLEGDQPQKTVGSYWPAATTLWDYVNRAMPFDRPGGLTADEVYATVAYVLYLNDIVAIDDPIGAATLPAVEMPNRDGFVTDPRPDIAPTAPPGL